jgi:hypothetical protein
VTFELRNAGNKHAVPLDIRLQGLDATGATVWERSQDAWYILSGDRRIYEVPVEREDCLRTRAVAVQVKVGEQTLTERVDVPAPACAP